MFRIIVPLATRASNVPYNSTISDESELFVNAPLTCIINNIALRGSRDAMWNDVDK